MRIEPPFIFIVILLSFSSLLMAATPEEFRSPPDSARPWVYWFIMDGNLTREGITADLEAMKDQGVGGVILMEVNVGVPRGGVDFMSDGRIAVTGSIKYEGQVPESGTIAFISDGGAGSTYGGPYANGKYKERVPVGEYLVRITGDKRVPLDMPVPHNMPGNPPITYRDEQIIPDFYGQWSKLQITIDQSKKTYDFDLKMPEE